MLPLTQPKWQVSSWSPGMSLVVKGLLFSLQGMSVRRGSVLGVGEHCSNVCAVIKAGYLDFVGGWPKWCCGWALVAQIPGYLLERFLRDHPKNKPVPSKVYSVHAWSQKLASILLSSVNCICCLLLLQLCVVMGTHWPFGSEFSLVPRAVQRAWASMQRARGGVRWPCWQGLWEVWQELFHTAQLASGACWCAARVEGNACCFCMLPSSPHLFPCGIGA